jgi:hypothetical protein
MGRGDIMIIMNTKITAKDFFFQIAVIVTLYVGTIALLNLLFTVINSAFPQVSQYSYYSSASLSLPVATLIVVFPLFLFLSNLLQKSYKADPARREYPVRKWLIYITLFLAGGILAGDLITLIYYFLDGRELTTGFILKVLAVLVVMLSIFGYYVDDLKGRLTGGRRTVWRIGAILLVTGSILVGFSVLGSPASQRMMRYDSEKVRDLSDIQWQIVNYWELKRELPAVLSDLENPIFGFSVPRDSQTGDSYVYNRVGPLTFELCANFNRTSLDQSQSYPVPVRDPYSKMGDTWQHDAGEQCFTRTIDPELYPVRPR